MSERTSLREIAALFLKLGTIGFGGPAAHIAMMEDEVVRRRRWLTREEFLDYVGATNFIPGPNSTELAIHIGHARAGWTGLLVAGTCFILPAALIVAAMAAAYVRYGSLPETGAILHGVKAVVIVIVAQALVRLGRTALKSRFLTIVAALAVLASALGVHELAILGAAGVVMAADQLRRRQRPDVLQALVPPVAVVTSAAATAAVPYSLPLLFGTFVKIGSVLFGSGYVLLAFLRADLVERLGWLTEQQLLDAVAVGQVTPGPLFTTATFIGYLLDGPAGAAAATIGIFLPAFVFVAISGPLVPRLRRSPLAGAVLDGINVASLALMGIVTFQLGRAALVDATTIGIAAIGALLLFRRRVNPSWLVAGGAIVGLLAELIRRA